MFVADGDTLRVGDETVRLAGMDAVERGQFCTDPRGITWTCGESARVALDEMVARGGLRCTRIERDRYRRTVARCSVRGVGDIGAAMVAAGWAISSEPLYDAKEKDARSAKQGIWAGTFEAPKGWRAHNLIAPKVAGQPEGN
ncbi:MAG: thermonuclease family protein [Sphingobium sp.]